MVSDLSTSNHVTSSLIVSAQPIEKLSYFKHLGTILDDELKQRINSVGIFKKLIDILPF